MPSPTPACRPFQVMPLPPSSTTSSPSPRRPSADLLLLNGRSKREPSAAGKRPVPHVRKWAGSRSSFGVCEAESIRR
jgi:hypothetical protein